MDLEQHDRTEDDYRRRTLGDLPLPTQFTTTLPTTNPKQLPLSDLEPEVLERLVAEFVARRSNSTKVHFYGRRGQAQYGLDIVEHHRESKPTLYQVRRLQSLEPKDIERAVRDYAGEPRPSESRRFDPGKFTLVTSAELDSDTRNIDALHALTTEYQGDLELEVWGAEALSRELRNYPRIVYAVFGPHWAEAWCGWRPTTAELAVPNALAFTNDPATVLGVSDTLIAAANDEQSKPREAANAYHQVAASFDAKGFPAHATTVRLSEARALRVAGELEDAFNLEFTIARQQVQTGITYFSPSPEDLAEHATTDQQTAKAELIRTLNDWAEHGLDLTRAIPALTVLDAASDPTFSELCLMTAEHALVDGLFDFDPADSPMMNVRSGNLQDDLHQLRHLISRMTPPSDPALRARMDCLIADASLTLLSEPVAVAAAYAGVVRTALESGYLEATGLAKSRLAFSYAQRRDFDEARTWWKSSIKDACEACFNGDAREALLAVQHLDSITGIISAPGVYDLMAALHGDARLLTHRFDPQLTALDAAHNGRLPDAFGDARRFLLESRLAGQRGRAREAMTLLADVLEAGGQPRKAVIAHIAAGNPEAAERIAWTLEAIDVSPWIGTGDDYRRSAINRVIGAQAHRYPDELVPLVAAQLLNDAKPLWTEISVFSPCPTWDAIKSLVELGLRIPEFAVDEIITLALPTIENSNLIGSETIAELLVNAYCAVPSRRADLADVLGQRMARQEATSELWDVIRQIPVDARAELIPKVLSAATAGLRDAVMCAASWELATSPNQIAARRAAAHLLRRPLNADSARQTLSLNEAATVSLLLGLMTVDEADLIEFQQVEFAEANCGPAAGTLMPMGTRHEQEQVDSSSESEAVPHSNPEVDDVARLAAGPRPQLLIAVVHKLIAVSENTFEGSGTRAHAIEAVARLAEYLDPPTTCAAVRAAEGVFQKPAYSPIDQETQSWDHGLSRVHIDTGHKHLRSRALKAASHMYRTARQHNPDLWSANASIVSSLSAGAGELLSSDDKRNRRAAAYVLFDLAESGDVSRDMLMALLGDRDALIRARTIKVFQPEGAWLNTLARDEDPRVRAEIARLPHLPADIRTTLMNDIDPQVRRDAEGQQPNSDVHSSPQDGAE